MSVNDYGVMSLYSWNSRRCFQSLDGYLYFKY